VGVGYYNLNQFSNAADYYQKALVIQPVSAEAFNDLGNAYRELLRYGDAETAYKHAIMAKSDWPTVYLNLAELYQRWPSDKQNHSAQAAKVLKDGLLATKNDPAILKALVDYYQAAGDTKTAAIYSAQLQAAQSGPAS